MSTSVAFVTTCKAFDIEPCGAQQYSAAFSWRREKVPEVVVVGDDLGAKEMCRDYGFIFEPRVVRGTSLKINCNAPLLSSVLSLGCNRVKADYICLINSDLILSPGFYQRLCRIVEHYGPRVFVTGIRLDFAWRDAVLDEAAYLDLWGRAAKISKYHPGGGTDYFVTHRTWWLNLCGVMPTWLMGQLAWDNWIHKMALHGARACVDATGVIDTLHPLHNYPHVTRAARLAAGTRLRQTPGAAHNTALVHKTGKSSIGNAGWLRLKTQKEKFRG